MNLEKLYLFKRLSRFVIVWSELFQLCFHMIKGQLKLSSISWVGRCPQTAKNL